MLDIGVMQAHNTYVNYIPQKTTSSASVLLLSPASLGGNKFRFTLQSLPGAVLQVQSSTNLATWTNLAPGHQRNRNDPLHRLRRHCPPKALSRPNSVSFSTHRSFRYKAAVLEFPTSSRG